MEVRIFLSPEFLEKGSSGLGDVDLADGFIVADPFARGTVVGAEKGVGLHGGAIGVEGIDIGGDAGVFVARVGADPVEDRGKAEVAKASLIFEQNVHG